MQSAEFCKRLISLRERYNLSQEQLAQELSITQQSLSRYEKGQRQAPVDFIIKLATRFNVTTDYLLGLSEIASTNENVHTACEVTGLSEDSVITLSYLKQKPYFKVIDMILSSEYDENSEALISILDKMLNQLEEESKMIAFAQAVCKVANVQFDCGDERPIFFEKILNQLQVALASVLPERLVYEKHYKGYGRFCLQTEIMKMIDSLSSEYKHYSGFMEIAETNYEQILKKCPKTTKEFIKELQEEQKKSNERTKAFFDLLGFDRNIFEGSE